MQVADKTTESGATRPSVCSPAPPSDVRLLPEQRPQRLERGEEEERVDGNERGGDAMGEERMERKEREDGRRAAAETADGTAQDRKN